MMENVLSQNQFRQYYRQILLPQVAESGQQKLLQQRVLIVGVGGLGCHVAQQLAAAGIGHLYLMDDDKVELSNLSRQILFSAADIGLNKVDCAKSRLSFHCPDTQIFVYPEKFTSESISVFARQYPPLQQQIAEKQLLVLDCSDNMLARQALNLWCVTRHIPLVSAAISAFSGQLLLVDMQQASGAGCYRCIFNENSPQQNCQSMGVLGPAVAAVASMQALLTLNHLLNIAPAKHYLHVFDGQSLKWSQYNRQRDSHCPACQSVASQSLYSLHLPNQNTGHSASQKFSDKHTLEQIL